MWGKTSFLMVFCVFSVFCTGAFGVSVMCLPGRYWNNWNCLDCPSTHPNSDAGWGNINSCYCLTPNGVRVSYGTGNCDMGSGGNGTHPTDGLLGGGSGGGGNGVFNYGDTPISGLECSSGYYLVGNYCKQCPSGFDKTDSGANKITDCYYEKTLNNAVQKRKFSPCSAGTYLKKASKSCASCPEGSWCPGGEFAYNSSKDQGIYKCPTSYPYSDPKTSRATYCYKHVVGNVGYLYYNCGSGKYFNVSDYSCSVCPDDFKKSDEGRAIRKQDCYKDTGGTFNTYYGHQQCAPGKYLPAGGSSCVNCKDGYVCPHNIDVPQNLYDDQGIFKCPKGYKKSGNTCVVGGENPTIPPEQDDPTEPPTPEDPNGDDPTPGSCTITGADNHCCKSGQAFQGQGQYYSNNQCVNCPSGFKNIEQNKTSVDSCFRQGAGGARLYYKQVSCSAGQYLPAGRGWNGQSDGCTACPDDGKSYCPSAGTYWPDMSKNQGIKECSNNKVPNSTRTACQNSSGGENGGGDNIGSEFTCTAGFYLPAYGGGCQECTITTKYCPGGKYKVGTTDRGIFDCPTGGVATSDWKSCDIKLSKIKMKFGLNGTSTKLTDQCWLKINIRDYAKCIFENSGSNNPYIHDNYKNEYEIETYNPNAPADS